MALPVCCPGAQSFAEFELVEFVVVVSVPWLLGIVVVVDDDVDELPDVVPDCAVARPPDKATKAATRRIRFMVTVLLGNVPSLV
ncbi:hypothetical protein LB523_24590 [Mesorhizobium sp. ESP-6-4]|uniref:hypothetical protein n=1 Tax=unclassified Mesorhizobium TaxID=325217 RepID=UPI001CCA748D|nr:MULTISPECIES: hypothetical protein [unclassified Mesorhizobium]MBZ9662231.1 hypothetical protein [Mesorhizobium sp. ESP-6-4]MBZ9770397.1 hypothetical protein [Mesorhizobium sp. CA6]MBZ9816475.1 hypothetical protein [Mesorhizobium sp. CA7]MBZ9841078.1 hypothetical protein [Mesorhizobium sp. CA5]MBZ9863171.1 hypothetical protein [Mesorhizobium sp. CA12]